MEAFCTLLLAVFVPLASADTVHGYCVPPATACTDNGTITPMGTNPPDFAFLYDGNRHNGHGDLWIIGLVPDNRNTGFSLTLDGTHTTNASEAGLLFSTTEFNTPMEHLSTYMNNPSFPTFPSPAHPLEAYLPSTQAVDPGANGYFVYTFNFGTFNYHTTPDPMFSVSGGSVPAGMVFLAVLTTTGNVVTIDIPGSATLIQETGAHVVPEPSSLLLLGSGLVGLGTVLRRKLV